MKYTKDGIIEKAKEFIKGIFKEDCTGHDVYHTLRVYRTALKIQEKEGGDLFLVSIASLLHDVDDYKLVKDRKETDDPYLNAKEFMNSVELGEEFQKQVIEIISSISFKANETVTPKTIEGKIVQDADRLDAIGAIGIARAFAYGGHKNSPLYNPDEKPMENMDFEMYKKHRGSTINHFYEKLLKLKDMINTETGREIALVRDAFMKEFLAEFYKEWSE